MRDRISPATEAGRRRSENAKILFVEPLYKPTLEIPGGIAEDNESPLDACRREIREELSLNLELGPLLTVDWVPAHSVWSDGIMFVFDGGVLAPDDDAEIKLADDDLRALHFLALDDAGQPIRPSMKRRLIAAVAALASGQAVFAEFDRIMSQPSNPCHTIRASRR